MGVSIEIYYTQHCNLLSGICRCTVINDTFEFYEFHHLIELSGNYNVHTINPHNPQALPHKKVWSLAKKLLISTVKVATP